MEDQNNVGEQAREGFELMNRTRPKALYQILNFISLRSVVLRPRIPITPRLEIDLCRCYLDWRQHEILN